MALGAHMRPYSYMYSAPHRSVVLQDPYLITIVGMIAFVFIIVVVLYLVYRRMCSKSSNNEGI